MADDEQFSLCWNNFNSNLSAGFHQSLVNGDLVDVTLAAEGKLVMAHRLVLSVCSPFFRQMFTQAPTNQPVFVFLKDVSHSALKDLIQFMYCGEVNVKQDALPAFISTAEALQIKGLTDSDPAPAQSPAEATPAPQPQIHQITTSPRTRQSQRTTTQKYKVETVEDTTDDRRQTTQIVIQTTAAPPAAIAQPVHHVQQQQQQQISNASTSSAAMVQRGAKRTAGVLSAQPKRTKTTIDPLDSQDTAATSATQQITVQAAVIDHPRVQQQQQQQQQAQSEPEYIDLPIELPTKAEPDYAEDGTEIDEADQDGTYVENDDYTDFQTRYDENYFTENEEAGNVTTGGNASGDSTAGAIATGGATTSKALMKQQLSDSSYVDPADQSTTDAQDTIYATETDVKSFIPLTVPFTEKLLKIEANKKKKLAAECKTTIAKISYSERLYQLFEKSGLEAQFGLSNGMKPTLLVDHYKFIGQPSQKDMKNGSWRCAKSRINKCKAKAITRKIDNIVKYVLTNPMHNHD